MRNTNKLDQWNEIRNLILTLRKSNSPLFNVKVDEKNRLSDALKENCKIELDMSYKSVLTLMEVLSIATRFINEKYKFRSHLLGISINSLKTYETRAKIKLGLDSIEFVKYWFLEKRIVRVFPENKDSSYLMRNKVSEGKTYLAV